jgi:hypothetical protein
VNPRPAETADVKQPGKPSQNEPFPPLRQGIGVGGVHLLSAVVLPGEAEEHYLSQKVNEERLGPKVIEERQLSVLHES